MSKLRVYRFSGDTSWSIDEEEDLDAGTVTNVIFEPDVRLVMELVWGGHEYEVSLQRQANGIYSGNFLCKTVHRGQRAEGRASCTVNTGDWPDAISTVGTWLEENTKYIWRCELIEASV